MHDVTFERDPLDRVDLAPDWGDEIPVMGEPSPTLPRTVELTWPQWLMCAEVGLWRYVSSRQKGMEHKYGYDGHSPIDDIEAAAAEYAASLAMNTSWQAGVNTFKGADNGNFTQVRATRLENGSLIVREDDPDEHRYVLVIVESEKRFNVVGWLFGSDAKQDHWKKAPNGRPPAYFVPQGELNRW